MVAALERLYAHHEGGLLAWIRGVSTAAHPLLDEGNVVGSTLLGPSRCYYVDVLGLAGSGRDDTVRAAMDALSRTVTPDLFYSAFRAPSMVTLWSERELNPVAAREMLRRAGAEDLLAIKAMAQPDLVLVLYAGLVTKRVLPHAERADLARFGLHVETALRARLHPELVIGTVGLDGRIELGSHVLTAHTRDSVRAQVGIIESLRAGSNRQDGAAALRLWTALAGGTLSLLERIDADGKRLYDLHTTAPWRRAARALTGRESDLVRLAIRGLRNKEIAHELGLTEGYVSRLLAHGAQKLGLTSVRDLLRLAARLDSTSSTLSTESLSPAEHEVLQLLGEGHSNQQIAEARGVATRTVANQVAAVLAKTGAASRRELFGRPPVTGTRVPGT